MRRLITYVVDCEALVIWEECLAVQGQEGIALSFGGELRAELLGADLHFLRQDG